MSMIEYVLGFWALFLVSFLITRIYIKVLGSTNLVWELDNAGGHASSITQAVAFTLYRGGLFVLFFICIGLFAAALGHTLSILGLLNM